MDCHHWRGPAWLVEDTILQSGVDQRGHHLSLTGLQGQTRRTPDGRGMFMRVAGIVPAYNEEVAIGKVVTDLRAAVPDMVVYVYDNCSTDQTAELATAAGAVVRQERRRGKGNVVRRAFADVDADVYLMIDGDDTYDAAAAPRMIDTLISGQLDHVLGVRRLKMLQDL